MLLRIFKIITLLLCFLDASAQKYVVGISENMPLKSYDTLQSPTGIFVELLNHIAEKENWELEYHSIDFDDCLKALKNGDIDIMPDLGYSEDRAQKYYFNKIDVLTTWGQLYTQENSDINTILDLNNKKVAIVDNDLFISNQKGGFLQLLDMYGIKCQFIYAKDYNQIFSLLENKKVDAGVVNRIFGDYNQSKYNVKRTAVVFSPVSLRFAFPKDDKYNNLIEKLDHHLKNFKEENNSLYYKLIDDYFTLKVVKVTPFKTKLLLLVLFITLFTTILFIYLLRVSVKNKTKELESALVKAKESDELKSVFLRNLSHEVRTPMNAINGFSLLLQDADLDSKTRNRYAELVMSSSSQLLSIVDNVLAVSLLETRQERINTFGININDLLDDLYTIFIKSLDEKNIKFAVFKELSDDKSIISTDGTKLRQILSNLIANAIKFTVKGFIEFGYKIKNEDIEFYVQDSGIGIDYKQKDLIFKLFSQEDNSANRRYGGAGLGLSIAKGYVELLGGKIYFESEKENLVNRKEGGTTFYFTIPYKKKSAD